LVALPLIDGLAAEIAANPGIGHSVFDDLTCYGDQWTLRLIVGLVVLIGTLLVHRSGEKPNPEAATTSASP